LHSCELETLQNEGVLEALSQARQAGKIRVAAYSGENEALDFAINSGLIQSVQFSVNPCDQGSIDQGLARATQAGLGVIAKRPVANFFWRFSDRPVNDYAEEYWVRAHAMQLDPGDLSWQEFTLRFAAYTPGVHTSIVGTANLNHLRENIEIVAKGPLPTETFESTRALFKQHDRNWMGQT
jgi:aryl-alcohol dehydrogenase-like predicted oxidoreductase